MRDYIAKDNEGNVVGKWRVSEKPTIPADFILEEVDSVSNYTVDYWLD